MEHFIKDRFGWECRRCRDAAAGDDKEQRASQDEGRARFFHEGEAEEGGPRLAARTLARRREAGGRSVMCCPVCGAEEEIR